MPTDASKDVARPGPDEQFNFTYNLSIIKKLIFNSSNLLGTNSLESPLLINPSINSSENQNTFNVKYKSTSSPEISNISSVLTSLSICNNFFVAGSYLIVLSGNILTNAGNMKIYITLPFILGGVDNTPSTLEITKILDAAKTQIAYGTVDGIILQSSLVLNTLIDPKSQYLYGRADKDRFDKSPFTSYYQDDQCFFIYKETVSRVSSEYTELLKLLNASNGRPVVNYITNINLYKNTKIDPTLSQTQSTGEIMIDCSPIEITTSAENNDTVMFKADNENKITSESTINSIFLLLFTFIICYILFKIFQTIWVIFIKKQTPDSQ